jgi:hypothetical protein
MSEPVSQSKAVYTAIKHVMEDMARLGVGKNQTNSQQNFRYRGVDDVMDALAPSLSKHGLIIVPHVSDRITTERESRSGGTLFHTLLKIDYDFICVNDGSEQHVGPIYGEAMDSGDKATNKAMATAYKYACIQTFCIPISGDDPDSQSHEIAAQSSAQASTHRTPKEELKEPSRSAEAASAVPARARTDPTRDAEGSPTVWRPTGNFAYGKKFYDVPFSVMTTRDLEWFLNAERTPEKVREKIVAELTWREHEASKLDAADKAHRQQLAEPFDDEIPM